MGNDLTTRSANPRIPTQFPVTVLTPRRQSRGQVMTMSDTSLKIILKVDLVLSKGDEIALSFSGGRLQGFMHRNEFYGQIIRRDGRELQVYFGQNDDMTRRYLAALKDYKLKASAAMYRPKKLYPVTPNLLMAMKLISSSPNSHLLNIDINLRPNLTFRARSRLHN